MHRSAAAFALALTATLPALSASAGVAPLTPEPEPHATTRLEVDLSERMLHIYTDGSLMNSFEVAIGEPEHPTPRGSFTIDRLIWNPDWIPPNTEWAEDETRKAPGDPDNPMQGAKIFFEYPDYYIHGTNAPGTLGEAASHGCLRMREVDVENLAEFLQKAGGEARSDVWFDDVRGSETNQVEVTLENPIPVEIHR